jgi:DNA-binding response OmpR family regulator
MNILIVEDNKRLAEALGAILEKQGWSTDLVYDGQSGLEYAQLGSYDALVLDIMLPKLNGYEVLQQLRAEGNATPILMLTARSETRDKVAGLDLGADDYLTKPFEPAELLARLRAITRRTGDVVLDTLTVGDTTLELDSGDLLRDSARVHLSTREFDLCKLLMSNPGQVFSKMHLLERIWGLDSSADENSVEAYVSFLRKKLAYLHSDLSVTTIRGLGYRLEQEA